MREMDGRQDALSKARAAMAIVDHSVYHGGLGELTEGPALQHFIDVENMRIECCSGSAIIVFRA